MSVVLVALGIIVGLVVAGLLPWMLLRKLESENEGPEQG